MGDLASRVARRFVADKLTRQWLLGVKRGWNAILKSSDPPYQQFKMLHRFLDKLREQVVFQKHGLGITFEGTVEREAFEKALQKAKDKLTATEVTSEADKKREYDTDIARQEASAKIEDRTGDSLRRLGLREFTEKYPEYKPYADAFHEAMNTADKWKYGGFEKQLRPVTRAFEAVMKILYAEAKALKHQEELGLEPLVDISAEKVFSLGRVKVVVVDNDLGRFEVRSYVKLLDNAHTLLNQKGLGKRWYGGVCIEGKGHKFTPEEAAVAKQYGYSSSGTGGTFKIHPNEVYIRQAPGPHVTETMIHELGHRYWFKVMKPAQRARFNALVRTKETEKHRDFPQGPVTEEGKYKPVFPVSTYGRSNIEEAFAEVFARYVLEKNITRDQVESFRSVLARAKHYRYDSQKLKQYNNPEVREESMRVDGGYSEWRIEIVPIKDIRIPKVWHPGRFEKAKKLLESGRAIDPIRAVEEGGSKWEIEDGIHRTNASIALGFTHMPVFASKWVETPEALVPESPEKRELPLGAWVQMNEPYEDHSYAWIWEQLGPRKYRGVKRYWYNLALVSPGVDWPDQGDFSDTEFEPTRPPPWGAKVKAVVEETENS